MSDNLVYYINGEYLPREKACISVHDLGLQRGYGVFDNTRTYSGYPFELYAHLRRFRNSAREIAIPLDKSDDEMQEIIYKLLAASPWKESLVRFMLTGGVSPNFKEKLSPSLIFNVEELKTFPEKNYTEGVSLMSVPSSREFPKVKTLNYIVYMKSLPELLRRGAFEILYTCDNEIYECSTSNFFLFMGDEMLTSNENVLSGVTRDLILKLAPNAFRVKSRRVTWDDVRRADEVFISSTIKEIIPVVKIDNLVIGGGTPGERTKKMSVMFRDYVKDWLDGIKGRAAK